MVFRTGQSRWVGIAELTTPRGAGIAHLYATLGAFSGRIESSAFRWIPKSLAQLSLVPPRWAKTPEYLAVNPNGRIPAIDDNGFKLWESMTINLYLAKKHGSRLLPKTREDEAQAIQWSFWVMTEVEKPALAVLLHRFFLPEDERDSSLDRLQAAFQHSLTPFEQQAGSDARSPGHIGHRHPGLDRLLDQEDLLGGRPTATPLD
jgi:hypothetical protein